MDFKLLVEYIQKTSDLFLGNADSSFILTILKFGGCFQPNLHVDS